MAKKSAFTTARLEAGLANNKKCAEFLGVTTRTVQNWDKKGAPAMAMRLLSLWNRWDCTAHGPEWAGFRFSRGRLVNAKAGLIFTPERLLIWPSTCKRLAELERERQNARKCPIMSAWRQLKRLNQHRRHKWAKT